MVPLDKGKSPAALSETGHNPFQLVKEEVEGFPEGESCGGFFPP